MRTVQEYVESCKKSVDNEIKMLVEDVQRAQCAHIAVRLLEGNPEGLPKDVVARLAAWINVGAP